MSAEEQTACQDFSARPVGLADLGLPSVRTSPGTSRRIEAMDVSRDVSGLGETRGDRLPGRRDLVCRARTCGASKAAPAADLALFLAVLRGGAHALEGF
jgi:hypothetical protein